jgi:hypothetical protein
VSLSFVGNLCIMIKDKNYRGKEYAVANAATRGHGGFPGRGGFGHSGSGGPSRGHGSFGRGRGGE